MAKIATSTVGSKGQVTIPEEVRRTLDLARGDRVEWTTLGDGQVQMRKVQGNLAELADLLGKPKRSATVDGMDTAVRDRFRKRQARR